MESPFEVSLGQESYVDQMQPIPLTRERLLDSDAETTPSEFEQYRTGLEHPVYSTHSPGVSPSGNSVY